MSEFMISSVGRDLKLGFDGTVNDQGGQTIGSWMTNEQNDIVIQGSPDDEGNAPEAETVPVQWKFNAKNQLLALDNAGGEIFNFNASGKPVRYELRESRLLVCPDRSAPVPLIFFVHGDWQLNDQHQLEFTVGPHTSVLDGFFSDTESRLTYHFIDRDKPWISNRLTFTGRWDIETEGGRPRTRFIYHRPDGTEGIFNLPGKLIIERGINQFRYTYDRAGRAFGITILGFLKVSENFEITYTIDKQESREGDELVKRTAFTLQGHFHGDRFSGDLNLVLVKDDDTPGDYQLAISGNYMGMVGNAQVMAGFQFAQKRKGRWKKTSFGFAGSIHWKDGHFVYALRTAGREVELQIGAEIRTAGGAVIDAETTIQGEGGRLQKVTFLLGVRF